jgi:hypothetical protein
VKANDVNYYDNYAGTGYFNFSAFMLDLSGCIKGDSRFGPNYPNQTLFNFNVPNPLSGGSNQGEGGSDGGGQGHPFTLSIIPASISAATQIIITKSDHTIILVGISVVFVLSICILFY